MKTKSILPIRSRTGRSTDKDYGFSVKDGTLYFGVKGGGTTIIFR